MPELRIALLTYSTRPRGEVAHTLALAEALARAGQDVTVWALADGGDTELFRPVDPAVRVCIVPVPPADDEVANGAENSAADPIDEPDTGAYLRRSIAALSAAFAGSKASEISGFDVVHTQDFLTANAVPGRIRTVHHLNQFTIPELVAAHERALVEPAAHVCLSPTIAAELAVGWGRSADVISSGVDAARFTAAAGDHPDAVEQRRYWTDRFGDYVLTVGGIEPRKGTLELVRAMARVRRRRPGTRLVIAGDDSRLDYAHYRRDVQALAARLRVEPEMLGPVPHAQLPSLVAAAGALAVPAVQAGAGQAALEALAAGVPVVTRDLPAFHELFGGVVQFADLGDGSSGEVAAGLAGQLVTALESRVSRSKAAETEPGPSRRDAGRALAAQQGWDGAAAAHLALYRRLISEGTAIGTRR